MNIASKLFVAIVAVLFVASPSYACDYCMLYQGSSPLQVNALSFRLDARYLVLHSLYDHGTHVANSNDQKETYFTTQLASIIPVLADGSVLLSLPLSSRRSSTGAGVSFAEPGASASGIGDASVLLRYRVVHVMGEEWVMSVALAGGVKLPTGGTNARNAVGEFADAHIQLGSGSFDPMIGVNAFAGAGPWGFSANTLCLFPGEGSRGYRFGNIATTDISAVYHLFPETLAEISLFVGAGIGGEWHAEEKLNGIADENTGGNTLFVTPLVRIDAGKFSVEGNAQIPVAHQLNGVQLGETYRVAVGVQYRK